MLTDIFAARYAAVPIWQSFGENERRLLVQAFRIISEQLFPYWEDGKERAGAKAVWQAMHDNLSMELGLQQLSPIYYQQTNTFASNQHTSWVAWPMANVCQNFMWATYDPNFSADQFMKERLSFIEIAFRQKEVAVNTSNASMPKHLAEAKRVDMAAVQSGTFRGFGGRAEALQEANASFNASFKSSSHELNERLRQAGAKLHYHNGFIQRSEDMVVAEQIETPFWSSVSALKWKNVDTDMKEAIDRRDSGQRDPAFYAARALESAIKIISTEKGWNHGGERGAASYIDNLASTKNGQFVTKWEQEALKAIFSHVRNELGHGPGGEPMPELSSQQTDWVIESCMSWIKNLIRRA